MLLNIFENDAFSLASMTDAINKVEYVPNRLGALGLFRPSPIRTKIAALDVRAGQINLVQTSQRGEAIESRDKRRKAQMKHFETSRLALHDRITADDLAFLRQFGTEDQIKSLATEIALRQGGNGNNGLIDDIDLTKEHMRLGALRGKVLDADGSLIYDYYAAMGVSEPSAININLTTLKEGNLRAYIASNIVRYMRRNRKGARFEGVTALCGAEAFDKLNKNPEYYDTFKSQQEASELRNSYMGESVSFAGCDWEEYQGTDDNSELALGDNEIVFVPNGETNTVFKQIMSPGEKFSHVGQLGQDMYSWLKPEADPDPSYVDVNVASYLLMLNTRPEMTRIGNAV